MTQPTTFPGLIDHVAARHQDRVFLPRRHGLGGDPVSFQLLRDEVRMVARALLKRGVGRGDRVAVIAENSYAWLLADQAIAYIGAVSVPRGVDTTPHELHAILAHSGARYAFGETDATVRELLAIQENLDDLEQIFSLADDNGVDGIRSLTDLRDQGAGLEESPLDAARDAVQPDDLLTIVYTSGTTAEPKGVMLTHANMASNAHSVQRLLGVRTDDSFLSVLPAWHVYERIMDYLALVTGAQLVYTTRRRIKEDLAAVQPTVFAAVPRIWESIHDGIHQKASKMTGAQGKLFRRMLANARAVGCGDAGAAGRLAHRLFRAAGLHKKVLDAITGGRMRLAVSGGGALPAHVDGTLLGIGMTLLNGYGLTETSPVVAVRPPENNRFGTIGSALEQTEVEIRDPQGRPLPDGEIGVLWVKGPQVMRGYYANEETTARVLQDGWFNTGDLGRRDRFGHLSITGRAKDTIVLAGGENVEPEPVETGIKSSTLIDQAVVLGQDEKALGAILIPIPESLEQLVPRSEWGEENGVLTSERVLEIYRRELDRTLTREAGYRPVERVAKFTVRLEPMTVENGLLTPTMKVKRHEVQRQMSGLIEGLFQPKA